MNNLASAAGIHSHLVDEDVEFREAEGLTNHTTERPKNHRGSQTCCVPSLHCSSLCTRPFSQNPDFRARRRPPHPDLSFHLRGSWLREAVNNGREELWEKGVQVCHFPAVLLAGDAYCVLPAAQGCLAPVSGSRLCHFHHQDASTPENSFNPGATPCKLSLTKTILSTKKLRDGLGLDSESLSADPASHLTLNCIPSKFLR